MTLDKCQEMKIGDEMFGNGSIVVDAVGENEVDAFFFAFVILRIHDDFSGRKFAKLRTDFRPRIPEKKRIKIIIPSVVSCECG
jgi:hypothetical protein